MVCKQLWALSCQRRGIAARAQLLPSLGGALAMVFEIGLTATQRWWAHDFALLTGWTYRMWLEALWLLYTVGMHWNFKSSSRPNRHQVCST